LKPLECSSSSKNPSMSISRLFKLLGAPLTNNRWSWGAQRATDGAVILRVWQDLKFIEAGRMHMLIDAHANDDTESLGYPERVRHIESIRNGAPCFMVMCSAHDAEASPRKIGDFDDRDIFVGAQIVETPSDFRFPPLTGKGVTFLAKDGATWVQVAGRKPMSSMNS
jgi:hypothetical protein